MGITFLYYHVFFLWKVSRNRTCLFGYAPITNVFVWICTDFAYLIIGCASRYLLTGNLRYQLHGQKQFQENMRKPVKGWHTPGLTRLYFTCTVSHIIDWTLELTIALYTAWSLNRILTLHYAFKHAPMRAAVILN